MTTKWACKISEIFRKAKAHGVRENNSQEKQKENSQWVGDSLRSRSELDEK